MKIENERKRGITRTVDRLRKEDLVFRIKTVVLLSGAKTGEIKEKKELILLRNQIHQRSRESPTQKGSREGGWVFLSLNEGSLGGDSCKRKRMDLNKKGQPAVGAGFRRADWGELSAGKEKKPG